jgi:hypothetical protein
MGNGQWAMGNTSERVLSPNPMSQPHVQYPMTNAQYFGFPVGRYANGEAMPQALRSVQVPNAQFPMPNSQCPIPNSQFPIPNSQEVNYENFF